MVDYDALVQAPDAVLPDVFEFIGAPYRDGLSAMVHNKSVQKAQRLGRRQREAVASLCLPAYERVRRLASSLER